MKPTKIRHDLFHAWLWCNPEEEVDYENAIDAYREMVNMIVLGILSGLEE